MRIENPVVFIPARPGRSDPRPGRGLAQAMVAPVAATVSALIFETEPGAAQGEGAGRLGGEIGGVGLPRPIVSTRLPLRRGGLRHVLLVGQAAERLARTPAVLTLDGAPIAAIDPTWLQSPLVEPASLMDGLAEDGRRRLLRMLTTTGASLFGGGRAAGFGTAVLNLVRLLSLPELTASSICALGSEARLLSYRLPVEVASAEIETLVALSVDRVTRVAGFAAVVEPTTRGGLLHVVAPGLDGADRLIAVGSSPLVLGAVAQAGLQPVAPWLARRSEATQRWVEDALAAATSPDAIAAAVLRELRHRSAPAPGLAVRHLSQTPRGLLALADLDDPHGLIDALRIECGGQTWDLRAADRGRIRGGATAVGGFLAAVATIPPGTACRLRLVYGSGRVQTVCERRPGVYDGAIPAGFARLDREAAPALASARLSLGRRPTSALALACIGTPPLRPRLSLVIAAGANPDLIRARAALLFAEPEAGSIEVVYYTGAADSDAVSRQLADCHGVFGGACRVAILPDEADPAERLRAALDAIRGKAALVMGAEVLPAAPGWLAGWSAALGSADAPAMLGGTLLAADGAVIDAGGAVIPRRGGEAARIERRWLGLPSRELGAAASAPSDLFTAECVGLQRRAIAALRRLALHCSDPDALLLGLARRLRRGRAPLRTMLDGRFVRFVDPPAADPLDAAVDLLISAEMLFCARKDGGE